jgi:nitrite reductase/ring-hydroxylating ferredoxin subunit
MPSSMPASVLDLLGDDLHAQRPTVPQALSRCAPGDVVAARQGRDPVALYRLTDGRAYVVPDWCPHDGGSLSDGFVDGDRLVCARHQWEFDACSGACLGRRDVAPLPCRRVR